MKKILVISSCSKRGETGGLTQNFIELLRPDEKVVDISLLDISFRKDHKSDTYHAHHYYMMPTSFFVRLIMMFPYIRRWFRKVIVNYKLNQFLRKSHFDLIIVFEMPDFSDALVECAHSHGNKIMIYPWGSDVLRANKRKVAHHKNAFKNADYVCGYYDSVLVKHIEKKYCLDKEKLFLFNVALPGIAEINKLAGTMSREEMTKEIGIPESSFYIVCGYNGFEGHRHKVIIDNISKIKNSLPADYLLIFPITYGQGKDYYQSIKDYISSKGLRAVFLEKFLTKKQVTCLHLITDLFINIQPSDNGNAFLMEALSAKNRIICGKWLVYPQFEKYGLPYYQCETTDSLGETIKDVLNDRHQDSIVPDELVNDLRRFTPDEVLDQWLNFFENV